ncbi:MAG: hypothetical protein NUW21_11575 [Elusimicrobia bacterium]|nr:hypothetical protein [Elusimicrobiota bacterium]
MRTGRSFAVAVLLLALAGLAGLRSWREPAPRPLPADGEAARVEVRRPREDLILTRETGGPWVVARQNDLADSEAVERLLGGLRSLTFGPPIAPPSLGLAGGLGPADSSRVRVLDESGRPLFDGLFGRRLFGRSAYFRARDAGPVRLATGVEPELLLRSSSQWREPRLIPGGGAGGLEFFARGAWSAVPPEAARELCALRASRWATGALEGLAGFDAPLLRVRAPDGRGFTVGDRRGRERLVRVDGRDALLRIHASAIEALAADLIR